MAPYEDDRTAAHRPQAASDTALPEQYVLTLSCPDKQGIVHAVSSYLFMTGCNIEDSQQFGDHDTGLFFMRVHFSADSTVTVDKLRASFAAIGEAFRMEWQIHRAAERMRIVLMVSKFGHCLNDLLFRSRTGRCPSRSSRSSPTTRSSPSSPLRTASPSGTSR